MKETSSMNESINIKNVVMINTTFLRHSYWIQRVSLRIFDITDKADEKFYEPTIVPANLANSATNLRSTQQSRRQTNIPDSIVWNSLRKRPTIQNLPKTTFTVFDVRIDNHLLAPDSDMHALLTENDGEPIFNESDGEPTFLENEIEPKFKQTMENRYSSKITTNPYPR